MVRNLIGGHALSIAKAVMAMMESVRESLFHLFLLSINEECNVLCQWTQKSLFRKISVAQSLEYQWTPLVDELKTKSPLLCSILQSIATRSDGRNTCKVGAAHNPGICMSASVILKERNREMNGVQSLMSLLMYSCHCEKKVNTNYMFNSLRIHLYNTHTIV